MQGRCRAIASGVNSRKSVGRGEWIFLILGGEVIFSNSFNGNKKVMKAWEIFQKL